MADTKITGLPANTTPLSTDVTVIIDDPGGTPVSMKITLANLMALFANPVSDDGDALGTTALRWADLFLASGGAIDWNNGNTQLRQTAANTLEVITASLVTETPVSGRPPLLFNTGGTLDLANDGGMGMDATNLYATTDQGNPGYIPVYNFIRANATRTYTSNTSLQNIFNSPANGRLTIETGTYLFRGTLSFQAMSGTSGNRSVNIVGGGSATCSAFAWNAWGFDGTVSTVGAAGASHNIATGSTTSIVTATTGTSLIVSFDGSFECTVAGTIQPQTAMVTAAASTLTIGSIHGVLSGRNRRPRIYRPVGLRMWPTTTAWKTIQAYMF